jgi:hypothetical protein
VPRLLLILFFFFIGTSQYYCVGQNENQKKVLKALEKFRNQLFSDSVFFKEILTITRAC